MQRSLNTFPISSGIRSKLTSNGYNIAEDLKNVDPVELTKEIGITLEEASTILDLIAPQTDNKSISLLDLLKDENHSRQIITFSQKLDEMLGGGIPLSKITEIAGPPGIGKTQFCLQLSVDVQIPREFAGLGEQVVYIDTEGTFTFERLKDIANATIHHCHSISRSLSAVNNFTVSSILENIHYFRCIDHIQLIATINLLPDHIKANPKIRLIIIDNIALPFRIQFEGKVNARTRILSELGQTLTQLATEYKLAVVITNQMSTNFESEGRSSLIPALGETWGHTCTLRLILSWQGNQRFATLNKSPFKQESTVQFQIIVNGKKIIYKM
uniref:DNA repair protein RAD51 homolog 3 n=1 Tax=Strigamia maritima TaxID=126957 RepID=T1J2H1_STRMM